MSLSRDAGTGDYALEAGALVLADQGSKKTYIFALFINFFNIWIDKNKIWLMNC